MLPIKNISYLLPMCCSFWEKCKNSPKTGMGCSTPLTNKMLNFFWISHLHLVLQNKKVIYFMTFHDRLTSEADPTPIGVTWLQSYNLTSVDLWPWYVTFDFMNLRRLPCYIHKPIGSKWTSTFQMRLIYILNLPCNMTLEDPDIWPLTLWNNEGSHVISINRVWFHLGF